MGAARSLHEYKDERQPVWHPNTQECQRCERRFGLIGPRPHHCRHCGACVCHQCSTSQLHLPDCGYQNPERVCDDCFDFRMRKNGYENRLIEVVEDEEMDVVILMDLMKEITENFEGKIDCELWAAAVKTLRKKSSEELENISRNLDLIIEGEAGVLEEVGEVVDRAGKFQQGIVALERQGVDELEISSSYSVKVDTASRMLYHMELSRRRVAAEYQLRRALRAFEEKEGALDRLECIVLQEKLSSALIVRIDDLKLIEDAQALLTRSHGPVSLHSVYGGVGLSL